MKMENELTDTSRFLLPCFGISYRKLVDLGFINCFLSDKDREPTNETDIHLYLLFKPSGNQVYLLNKMVEDFEKKDKDHLVLLEDYDYEGGFTILVFRFPEKYRNDYKLFLDGGYSRFSEDFKNTFPEEKQIGFDEFGTIKGKSLQWMVVHKDNKLRKYQEKKYGIDLSDAPEYYHKIIMEDEVLDIDAIRTREEDIQKRILDRDL